MARGFYFNCKELGNNPIIDQRNAVNGEFQVILGLLFLLPAIITSQK